MAFMPGGGGSEAAARTPEFALQLPAGCFSGLPSVGLDFSVFAYHKEAQTGLQMDLHLVDG